MRVRIMCALFMLWLASCQGCPDPDASGRITFGEGPGLTVRIADSDEERARGLTGVQTLGSDEGMAFVYDQPTTGTFWMKDTVIPLSIAFVDVRNQIVSVVEMEPCSAEPCPSYGASEPYVMAVEANAGWFDRHGIHEGDMIGGFERPICE